MELYVGRVDTQGDLIEGHSVAMQATGQDSESDYNYVVETSITRSGLHGFTVRVRPSAADMSVAFIPGLICWAVKSRAAVTTAN